MIAGQLYRPNPTVITPEEYERMTAARLDTATIPTPEQVPVLRAAGSTYPRLVRASGQVRMYADDGRVPVEFTPVHLNRVQTLVDRLWVFEVNAGCDVSYFRLTAAGGRALAAAEAVGR